MIHPSAGGQGELSASLSPTPTTTGPRAFVDEPPGLQPYGGVDNLTCSRAVAVAIGDEMAEGSVTTHQPRGWFSVDEPGCVACGELVKDR